MQIYYSYEKKKKHIVLKKKIKFQEVLEKKAFQQFQC